MKRNQKRTLSKVLAYIFQISLSLIFVLPLVWMIVSSLKPEADLFKDMSSIATFFVSNPSLDNYKEMLSKKYTKQYDIYCINTSNRYTC